MTKITEEMVEAARDAYEDFAGEIASRQALRLALAAAFASRPSQGGEWVVVPKEPTDEMLEACWSLHHPWGANAPAPEERPDLFAEMKASKRADWSAMLSAAPVKP